MHSAFGMLSMCGNRCPAVGTPCLHPCYNYVMYGYFIVYLLCKSIDFANIRKIICTAKGDGSKIFKEGFEGVLPVDFFWCTEKNFLRGRSKKCDGLSRMKRLRQTMGGAQKA